MSGEVLTGIQLGFYGLVVILFLVLLAKLEKISTLLAEANNRCNQNVATIPTGSLAGFDPGVATEDEIAAVLAVIARFMPDKKVASVRMVSK